MLVLHLRPFDFSTKSFVFHSDVDGDEIITRNEFMAIDPEANAQDIADNSWAKARREEFDTAIDTDKDGKASLKEIEVSL